MSNALTDSAESEQEGRTGSEVSTVTGVEERSMLLCWLVLNLTYKATYKPASLVSSLLIVLTLHISTQICQLSLLFFMAASHLDGYFFAQSGS